MNFFLFSAYFLLFLITTLGFCTFSIAYTGPQNRLSICGILILTAVNFRWLITARLPSVSYLTFLDQFSLGGICILVALFLWHAIIGCGVINTSTSTIQAIEMYVAITYAVFYVLFLILMFVNFLKIEIHMRTFKRKSEKEWQKLEERKKLFKMGNFKPEKEESNNKPSELKREKGLVVIKVKEVADDAEQKVAKEIVLNEKDSKKNALVLTRLKSATPDIKENPNNAAAVVPELQINNLNDSQKADNQIPVQLNKIEEGKVANFSNDAEKVEAQLQMPNLKVIELKTPSSADDERTVHEDISEIQA
jgi:hypothetical protein